MAASTTHDSFFFYMKNRLPRLKAITGWDPCELWLGALLFVGLFPLFLGLRLYDLSNPLIEPHPIRQTQTALTIREFVKGHVTVWNYQSPYQGKLWNFVHEFPAYQWTAAQISKLGLSIEVSARCLTLFCFLIGSLLFWDLARKFTNRSTASWALLLFWITPFSVVNSRTCLIDFPALTLMLGSLWCLHQFWEREKSIGWWLAACLLGVLGGVTKTNLWFTPLVGSVVLAAWGGFQRPEKRSKTVWVIAQALIQFVAVLLWIRWTMHVRGMNGAVLGNDTMAWIIGPLSTRLSATHWKAIVKTIVRGVYHDWMLIPALVGIFFSANRVALISLTALAFSVAVTFNVHAFHDYYFIGEFPFLILIAAVGLSQIFRMEGRAKAVLLTMTIGLLVPRLYRLEYVLAPLVHDYRQHLTKTVEIEKGTDPEELVYVESKTEAWEVPFYANRDVILSPYFANSGLSPSAFFIDSDTQAWTALSTYDRIWVDTLPSGRIFFRVGDSKTHHWDASSNILLQRSPPEAKVQPTRLHETLSTCGQGQWVRIPASGSRKKLNLKTEKTALVLPRLEFAYLPGHSELGCQWTVQ